MKTQVWIYIQKLKNGTRVPVLFGTGIEAENYANDDLERDCDGIFEKTLDIDDKGELRSTD